MKKSPIFHAANFAINVLLISSLLLTLFGAAWEYSTRQYLEGFSNAVIPYASSPEKKVTAIIAWMEHGPARQIEDPETDAEDRDPVDTLNYQELLRVCGTATNAFVNLASSGGIETRRLLLLDAQGLSTNHVVAEVRMEGRWVIVDPSFHALLRNRYGRLLTRQELAQPSVLRDATRNLSGYDPGYNYEHTTLVHLSRVPLIGRFLPGILNSIFPGWEETINWTELIERQSYTTLFIGIALLFLGLCLQWMIARYGRKLGMIPTGPWEQLRQGSAALFVVTSFRKSAKQSPTV